MDFRRRRWPGTRGSVRCLIASSSLPAVLYFAVCISSVPTTCRSWRRLRRHSD